MVPILAQGGLVIDTVAAFAIVGGAGAVIAYLFKLLMDAKQREFDLILKEKEADRAELEGMKKSYQEIAFEALKSAKETANFYRAREGKPPIIPPAPVVPESHSPSTPLQREVAAIATMRATMAEIKERTGQPPRPTPPEAREDGGPVSAVPQTPEAPTTLAVVREEIARLPEQTAERVVERLEEGKPLTPP